MPYKLELVKIVLENILKFFPRIIGESGREDQEQSNEDKKTQWCCTVSSSFNLLATCIAVLQVHCTTEFQSEVENNMNLLGQTWSLLTNQHVLLLVNIFLETT